ncbi:hypothetical protein KP509_01G052200 [Ceratopteris richardii]|nr:hypothetical protein KP509_01G052200 [Ceratopteris richardii]
MLLCRIGSAQYQANRSADNGDGQERDPSSFTSDISFQELSIELVDVHYNGCKRSISEETDNKVYGKPISLVQDAKGLSGHVNFGIHMISGSFGSLKLDITISLETIKLQFTAHQIQSLLNIMSSYHDKDRCSKSATVGGLNLDDLVSLGRSEHHSVMKTADLRDDKETTLMKSMLGSQFGHSKYPLFPGTNLISDWMHWNGQQKDAKEMLMSEDDFAASTEEFFDCLSESGLWMWTCSALSASATSSLMSRSAVLPQESLGQVTNVKLKISGLSVMFHEDLSKVDTIEVVIRDIDLFLQANERCLEWQLLLKQIEVYASSTQEQGFDATRELGRDVAVEAINSSPKPLQALVEQCIPKFHVSLSGGTDIESSDMVHRKCFMKILDQHNFAALQVNAKVNFSSTLNNTKASEFTEIGCQFQPLILWFDAPIVRTVQKLTETCGKSANRAESKSLSSTSFSPATKKTLQINAFCPHIRIWICSPCSPAATSLFKDHLLCLDLLSPIDKSRKAMVKLKLSNAAGNQLCIDSASLAFKESYLYLVSPSVHTKDVRNSSLGFHASKVLSISLDGPEVASIEVFFKSKSGVEVTLAERVWMAVDEQQKGGMGGRMTNSEFAAATATEVMNEKNHKLREEIVHCSSTHVVATVPKVNVELYGMKYTLVAETLMSMIEASVCRNTLADRSTEHPEDNAQVTFSLHVGEAELTLHSKFGSVCQKYAINVSKLNILHVLKLGMIENASYFWLHHGNGSVKGSISSISPHEIQLLTCSDAALGRGDGGGGNALASKSAGIEVSIVSWPGGGHLEDTLITISLGGCTFMAHGGNLDWLPELIAFFNNPTEINSISYAVHETDGEFRTETFLLQLKGGLVAAKEETAVCSDSTFFSLNLHDVALCYEPGTEAVAAAVLSEKNSTEQFNPVACAVAATGIRVSSKETSNVSGRTYEIQLRDVALLLVDTTFRHGPLDYTSEALHQTGYVKVAGEAVMKAVIHLNPVDGLDWEVECANNQLRFDTCHDSTAALGRLIAQLQQLFAVQLENPVPENRDDYDANACFLEDSSQNQVFTGCSDIGQSDYSVSKSKTETSFEVVDDVDLLVRGCSIYACLEERFELLNKSVLSNDDMQSESRCSSSYQWSQSGWEGEYVRTPTIPDNEGTPLFIEDYYASNVSSLQLLSSSSSSWHQEGPSMQGCHMPCDDHGLPMIVDGSGGWYDGQNFEVVENHVLALDSRTGSEEHKGGLLQPSWRRSGLYSKYPQSIGRLVFRDLNLRWRLHGDSDWPVSKRKDSENTTARLEVLFRGVDLQHDIFPRAGVHASRLVLSIRDIGIYDCSKDAPWKKILGYHRSKSRPRESYARALRMELESVRPNPSIPAEEYRLSLQLLPLLLHLDQRHVDFLTNFFSAPLASHQQEISSSCASSESNASEVSDDSLLPFFQICELQPFSVRVDYVPRHVDISALRSGKYAELANFVSWKGIELELKHVRVVGVHGWGAVFSSIIGEWLEDISQRQVHRLLKGLGPIRPLFAVGSGAVKLVALPAEQYKRDHRRLLRGMRKGITAFLRSVSLEAVGLGVQLAAGAHEILLQTESALGTVGLLASAERVELPDKSGQPGGMREGLHQAYESLSQGFERTASSLISNPLKAYHKAGTSTAVASALRGAPVAAVAPAVAAASALHRALLGMRNSLDPEHKRESEEKHSGPPPE